MRERRNSSRRQKLSSWPNDTVSCRLFTREASPSLARQASMDWLWTASFIPSERSKEPVAAPSRVGLELNTRLIGTGNLYCPGGWGAAGIPVAEMIGCGANLIFFGPAHFAERVCAGPGCPCGQRAAPSVRHEWRGLCSTSPPPASLAIAKAPRPRACSE
jgi:hypothetical protein